MPCRSCQYISLTFLVLVDVVLHVAFRLVPWYGITILSGVISIGHFCLAPVESRVRVRNVIAVHVHTHIWDLNTFPHPVLIWSSVEKPEVCRTKAVSQEVTGKKSGRIYHSLRKLCTCCPPFFVLDLTVISCSQLKSITFYLAHFHLIKQTYLNLEKYCFKNYRHDYRGGLKH